MSKHIAVIGQPKNAFVIMDNEDCEVLAIICSENIADAQEFILSLAEENLYEDYLTEIQYYGTSHEKYWELAERRRNEYNNDFYWRTPMKSVYAYMLNECCPSVCCEYSAILF